MSQQQKLVERFSRKPADFTWDELISLLKHFGYDLERGSGSRRRFFQPEKGDVISLHQPHPKNVLKAYQVKDVLNHLRERGYL